MDTFSVHALLFKVGIKSKRGFIGRILCKQVNVVNDVLLELGMKLRKETSRFKTARLPTLQYEWLLLSQ